MENSDTQYLREQLLDGCVIPACPLALDSQAQWSQEHQTALTRYYHAAGAGGLAVAVHSTQFTIRDPEIGLFAPLLEQVASVVADLPERPGKQPFKLISGVCGSGESARKEAELAAKLGYSAILVSPGGWGDKPESAFLDHCRELSGILPIIGFYLQPSVGGRLFSHSFWREMVEIPNLVAIKIAPFNRYQTLDVTRALAYSGREDVALYTGNDDNIVFDLLTKHQFGKRTIGMSGGLLGQWGVWTHKAVELLDSIKATRKGAPIDLPLYEKINTALTDANAVIFDAANAFRGCIPGIMEVLRRQGLVPSNRCLDAEEVLSPGQAEELDRIHEMYPFLNDDTFIRENLKTWLS